VGAHGNDLGEDRLLGPLGAKDLGKLLQVEGGGLANRIHTISEPRHAEVAELLVKEVNSQLLRE